VFGSARTPGPDHMLPLNLQYYCSTVPVLKARALQPTQSAFISFRNVADQLLRDGRTTDMPSTRAYAEDLRHPPDGQLCQGPSALTNENPDDREKRDPHYSARSRAPNPRFHFDDRAGRPIKRLHGVLRSATRTRPLLRFLVSTKFFSGRVP